MSTVIIGGGDHVRTAVSYVESASLGWTSQQRADAESLFGQFASCLKAVAASGNAASVTLTGP